MKLEKKIKALIFGGIFVIYNVFLIIFLSGFPTLQVALAVWALFVFLFIWFTRDVWLEGRCYR